MQGTSLDPRGKRPLAEIQDEEGNDRNAVTLDASRRKERSPYKAYF